MGNKVVITKHPYMYSYVFSMDTNVPRSFNLVVCDIPKTMLHLLLNPHKPIILANVIMEFVIDSGV